MFVPPYGMQLVQNMIVDHQCKDISSYLYLKSVQNSINLTTL